MKTPILIKDLRLTDEMQGVLYAWQSFNTPDDSIVARYINSIQAVQDFLIDIMLFDDRQVQTVSDLLVRLHVLKGDLKAFTVNKKGVLA